MNQTSDNVIVLRPKGSKMGAHFSGATPEWATPQAFFDALDVEFHFTLDPCSTHENAKCMRHFTERDNGLSQDWGREIVFMNPPYGRVISAWMKKAEDSRRGGGDCRVPRAVAHRHAMVA